MTSEKKDSLRDTMDGKFPPAYTFDAEGDMLIGTVKGFDRAYSKYGPHPVVIMQNEEDGEVVSVHCFHTALAAQMTEQSPAPGDRIAIKFLGDKEAKGSDRVYKNFRVRVDSKSRSFADVATPEEDDDMPF